MLKKSSHILLRVCCMLAILSSSACATPTEPPRFHNGSVRPVRGGTWIDDLYEEPTSLIPNTSPETSAAIVDQTLYAPLFYGDEHGVLHPGLAAAMPTVANGGVSADLKTWTFHLRPGLKWNDGQPEDARDVDFTWRLWTNPKFPAASTVGVNLITSTEVSPDHLSITFHLKQGFEPFLAVWADATAAPLPAHHFSRTAPDGILKSAENLDPTVTSGPFMMQESQPADHYTVVRNPTYWETGKPYVDEVDWIVLPDQSAANSAFQAGQVDMLGVTGDTITAVSAAQLKKANPAASLLEYLPVGTSLYLNINTRMSPVKDARVRQAISFALDRDEFIRTFSAGRGGWALAGAFPDTYTQEEIKQILRYDPANAKQLLAAAGLANGVDIEFVYPGSSYGQDYVSALQLMQAQLKKVGINLSLKSHDKDAWTNSRKSLNFVMTASGKGDLVGDVDSWLYDFHSGNKSNYSAVDDPKLDALIDAQRREPDAAKRKDLVRQAVRLLNEQAYSLAIWAGNQFQFWQPLLKGYAPNFGVKTAPETDSWVAASTRGANGSPRVMNNSTIPLVDLQAQYRAIRREPAGLPGRGLGDRAGQGRSTANQVAHPRGPHHLRRQRDDADLGTD